MVLYMGYARILIFQISFDFFEASCQGYVPL
jgi:hypothetical protein